MTPLGKLSIAWLAFLVVVGLRDAENQAKSRAAAAAAAAAAVTATQVTSKDTRTAVEIRGGMGG